MTDCGVNAAEMEIFENNEKHYQAFIELNEQWITRYFEIEDADRKLASDPHRVVENGGYIFSLVSGNEVVGVCALFNDGSGVYELARMAVRPDQQGRKFGNRLMEIVLDKLAGIGASRVYLLSNSMLTRAITMYRKYGFKTVSEGQHPAYSRCNIVMERDISPVA